MKPPRSTSCSLGILEWPGWVAVVTLGLGATACTGGDSGKSEASGPAGWRELFNHEDLDGWEMTGAGEFRVQNGELVTYGGSGMLAYTREPLGTCEIKVVYEKTEDADNSGIFVRVPDPPREPLVAYPGYAGNHGFEVQIDDTEDGYHRTGCLYSLTKAKAVVSSKVGESVEMVIRLEGPRTAVTVNGQLVSDYLDGDPVPPKVLNYEPDRGPRPDVGYIGLQNHQDPVRVHFKEVSVRAISVSSSSTARRDAAVPDSGDLRADGGACTIPPLYGCGFDGTNSSPCLSGLVCCLWPPCGADGGGTVSRCVPPVAATGQADQCEPGTIQLCDTDAACGPGYHCDPDLHFCVLNP